MKKTAIKICFAILILILSGFAAFGQIKIAEIFRPKQNPQVQNSPFNTRCGWLDNPTPANYSLSDKDREWIIGVQGGYKLEDFEMPVFKPNQWIITNTADYGYGCACFEMRVDAATNHVLEVKKSYAKPLSACRKDKALKKWKDF